MKAKFSNHLRELSVGVLCMGFICSNSYGESLFHRHKPKAPVQHQNSSLDAIPLETLSKLTIKLRNGENGYFGTRDTYISSDDKDKNFGKSASLQADGFDFGDEFIILIAWDMSAIPVDATVLDASLTFKVFNNSNGLYKLYENVSGWSEHTATWQTITPPDDAAKSLAVFKPMSIGTHTIKLSQPSLATLQKWINQPALNHGFMIRAVNTRDGFDIRSSEHSAIYQRPKLTITYK